MGFAEARYVKIIISIPNPHNRILRINFSIVDIVNLIIVYLNNSYFNIQLVIIILILVFKLRGHKLVRSIIE